MKEVEESFPSVEWGHYDLRSLVQAVLRLLVALQETVVETVVAECLRDIVLDAPLPTRHSSRRTEFMTGDVGVLHALVIDNHLFPTLVVSGCKHVS